MPIVVTSGCFNCLRSVELFCFTFNMENISPYPLEVTFNIDQGKNVYVCALGQLYRLCDNVLTSVGLREPSKTWFMDATESRKVTLHLKKFTVPDAEVRFSKQGKCKLCEGGIHQRG